MSSGQGYERPAIAGSGTIAAGLAACASALGEVRLLARSDASAWRAEEAAHSAATKLDGGDPKRIKVTTDAEEISDCDLIVEAIVEETGPKVELLTSLAGANAEADLATTTSSLSLAELGAASGQTARLFALHVFNPVPRMQLIELCFPAGLGEGIAERARAWCLALGKQAVEVPDQRGFVVNRLLFPYLFDAVRLMERTGMGAEDVDRCMALGAGHPMGPLKLLDFVGLDVAQSIGEALYGDSSEDSHRPPGRIVQLVGEGKLGRKSGAGFYDYS